MALPAMMSSWRFIESTSTTKPQSFDQDVLPNRILLPIEMNTGMLRHQSSVVSKGRISQLRALGPYPVFGDSTRRSADTERIVEEDEEDEQVEGHEKLEGLVGGEEGDEDEYLGGVGNEADKRDRACDPDGASIVSVGVSVEARRELTRAGRGGRPFSSRSHPRITKSSASASSKPRVLRSRI